MGVVWKNNNNTQKISKKQELVAWFYINYAWKEAFEEIKIVVVEHIVFLLYYMTIFETSAVLHQVST